MLDEEETQVEHEGRTIPAGVSRRRGSGTHLTLNPYHTASMLPNPQQGPQSRGDGAVAAPEPNEQPRIPFHQLACPGRHGGLTIRALMPHCGQGGIRMFGHNVRNCKP